MADKRRSGDAVYRFGDEQFAVILPEQTLAKAAVAMERTREAVERLAISFPPSGVLTLSAGVVELNASAADSTDALSRASEAVERTKHQGGNSVVVVGA